MELIRVPLADTNWINATDFADLATADAYAASNGRALLIDSAFTISTAVTLNSDIVCEGGTFVKSGSGTLTISGTFRSPSKTVFSGFSAGNVVFSPDSVEEIPVEWFGAVIGADSGANINVAIAAANGKIPVVLSGVYFSTVTINANISGTYLKGIVDGYKYGISVPTAAPCGIKFTAALTNGVTQYSGSNAQPYITIENLSIDGNSLVTNGINGGFFVVVRRSTILNCTGPGQLMDSQQDVKIIDSSYTGNQDGFITSTYMGTIYAERSSFRLNTRYGANIQTIGGASKFSNCIFETNTSHGLLINGTFVAMKFDGCYFENNDNASSPPYHVNITEAAYQGNNEGIVFDSCYFADDAANSVATIASGAVKFRDCVFYGGGGATPLAITTGNVILENSFFAYPNTTIAKVVPMIEVVNKKGALAQTGTDYIDLSSLAISFGTGDFTLSAVVELEQNASSVRGLIAGAIGGFTIVLQGDTPEVDTIVVSKSGSASHGNTVLPVDFCGTGPHLVTYVRSSTTGTFYIDGYKVGSITDSQDYTGNQGTLGFASDGLEGRIYEFNLWTNDLTAAQVYTLWKSGGNAILAGLSSSLAFNMVSNDRPTQSIFDSVSSKWLRATGSGVEWVNPLM